MKRMGSIQLLLVLLASAGMSRLAEAQGPVPSRDICQQMHLNSYDLGNGHGWSVSCQDFKNEGETTIVLMSGDKQDTKICTQDSRSTDIAWSNTGWAWGYWVYGGQTYCVTLSDNKSVGPGVWNLVMKYEDNSNKNVNVRITAR